MKLRTFLLLIALIIASAACSEQRSPEALSFEETAPEVSEATAAESVSDGRNLDAVDTSVPATGVESLDEAALARFIAASESAVAGTSLEGLVLADPDIYIALGQSSCARFSNGDTLDQLVADHFTGAIERTVDEERLLGAVLGAAVEVMCPEHAAQFAR